MKNNDLRSKYFEWLCDHISCHGYVGNISYKKLLETLHGIEFIYSIKKDENRAIKGRDLRREFVLEKQEVPNADALIDEFLPGPCSVLEMIIALAINCEDIMCDTSVGDRTSEWFWKMITNLGLGGMYDTNFDLEFVKDTTNIFLERKYKPNGSGGLFKINNCKKDLRKFGIWVQTLWYLDTMV